ncbi:MAG: hypothetical protein NVSMB2_28740 [Chloroflexota bacterium]
MPERASVFQGIQIGVETVNGTSVPATKQLTSMQIIPRIDLNIDTFRPMGNKYATVMAPGKELTTAQIQGKLTYTEIVYPFSSLFGAATITGVGPYTWVFNPASTAADTFSSFTVEQGNAVRAEKWSYGLFTGLSIVGSRDGFDIRGTMQGQAATDGITMTATPTAIPLLPVLGKQVSVFYDATSAGLGTTKLGRVLRLEFNFADKYSPLWAVDNTQASFVAMVEKAPTPTIKLVVEADAAGMALLTDARAGNFAYVRINGVSGTSSIAIDCAVKHIKPDAYLDQDGVFAIGFNLQLAHDGTWGTGKAMLATVVNSLAGL